MDYNEQAEEKHSDAKWHFGVERTDDEAWKITQTALLMEIRDQLKELNTALLMEIRDQLKELNDTSDSTNSLIRWIKEWWEENGWVPRF